MRCTLYERTDPYIEFLNSKKRFKFVTFQMFTWTRICRYFYSWLTEIKIASDEHITRYYTVDLSIHKNRPWIWINASQIQCNTFCNRLFELFLYANLDSDNSFKKSMAYKYKKNWCLDHLKSDEVFYCFWARVKSSANNTL